MRKSFFEYYPPENWAELWATCIFAFDASVLLNIYRYSTATLENFWAILNKLSDKIWLPHQAVLEYQTNRLNVISQQLKSYDDIRSLFRTLLADFQSGFPRHPHIDIVGIKGIIERSQKEAEELLSASESHHPKNLQVVDSLRDQLTAFFNGKVGEPFLNERLVEIYNLGEERYKNKQPPGFRDKDKPHPERYGDLVLWYQLIEKAKTIEKPIVFVVDDRKEDWWLKDRGLTIGPRPELIREMYSEAKVQFYAYDSPNFLKFAQRNLGLENEQALVEAREVTEQEETSSKARLARIRERLMSVTAAFHKLTPSDLIGKDLVDEFNEVEADLAYSKEPFMREGAHAILVWTELSLGFRHLKDWISSTLMSPLQTRLASYDEVFREVSFLQNRIEVGNKLGFDITPLQERLFGIRHRLIGMISEGSLPGSQEDVSHLRQALGLVEQMLGH